MKFTLIISCLATAIVAAPAPQMGDHSHGGNANSAEPAKGLGSAGMTAMLGSMSKMLPRLALYRTVTPKPVSQRSGVVREPLYYGPLTLKSVQEKLKEKPNPMQMDPQGNLFYHSIANFPKDISILTTRTDIRDANGNILGISQGIYNHHVSIPDLSRPATPILACPNKNVPADMALNSIAGVGEDGGGKVFSAEDEKETSGFYVGPTDNIFFTAEIINNANATKEVYIVIDVEYLKSKPDLTSSWHVLGVGTCEGSGLKIQPEKGQQKFALTSKPMTVLKDGYIFGIRGHLHDGGVSVVMKNNGKIICDSTAKYGGEGKVSGSWETISEMASCADRVPIPVKKGDSLTLETSYDFDLHPARKHGDGMMAEAMGLALFSFSGR